MAVRGRGPGRWTYFTFFALVNVVCWLALAAVVGVLATQQVNLGFETFVRQQQTRVVAAWRREVLPTPASTPMALPTGVTLVVVAPTEPERTPTPVPGSATANPAAPPVELDDPSISELVVLDAELQTWPPGRILQVTYTQQGLNRELDALLAANPGLPFRDVEAVVAWDELRLSGTMRLLGVDVPLVAVGQVLAVDCRPRVQVNSLTAGVLPAPGLVRDQVLGRLQQWIRWFPADHPLCIQDIQFDDGVLTVVGIIR
jgi:hypothetical protein